MSTLITFIQECIKADKKNSLKQSRILIDAWDHSTEKERALIDDTLKCLCGYDLPALIRKHNIELTEELDNPYEGADGMILWE